MRTWEYAELSKLAKIYGGPENLIKYIHEAGISKGRIDMLPWIGLTIVIEAGVIYLVYDHFKKEEAISEKQLDNTEIDASGIVLA